MFIIINEEFPNKAIELLDELKKSNQINVLDEEGIILFFTESSEYLLNENSLSQFMNVLPEHVQINVSGIANLSHTAIFSLIMDKQFISRLKIEAIATLFIYSQMNPAILDSFSALLHTPDFVEMLVNTVCMNKKMTLKLLSQPAVMNHLTDKQWKKLIASSAKAAQFIIKNYKEPFFASCKDISSSWLKELDEDIALVLLMEEKFVLSLKALSFLALVSLSVNTFEFILGRYRPKLLSEFLFAPELYSESVLIKLLSSPDLLIELGLNTHEEFFYFVFFSSKTLEAALRQPYKNALLADLKNLQFFYLEKKVNYHSIMITLLQDADFLETVENDTFRKLLVSSEKIAEFAITNKAVSNKLNNIEKNLYSEQWGLLPQTFEASCTACSILFVLKMKNLIPKEECTRTRELEIYKNIWLEPGLEADPRKTVSYLSNYGLNVMGVEFVTCREKKFTESREARRNAFHLFQKATDKNYLKINQLEDFDKICLKEKEMLLLIEAVSEEEHHVLICIPDSKNGLNVINPHKLTGEHYDSLEDYMAKKADFVGTAYHM